jgi:tetratricopeptide (TPR) repeat protein
MICRDCQIDNPPQYNRCLTCDKLLVDLGPNPDPELDYNEVSAPMTTKNPYPDQGIKFKNSEVRSRDSETHSRDTETSDRESAKGARAGETTGRRNVLRSGMGDNDESIAAPHPVRRSQVIKAEHKSGMTQLLGMIVAVVVLLVSAGATVFFLTKAPDDQRLYEQGQHELANGQYAFAVSTLNQASALKPDDPKIFLSLARAYVGVDQVDKAWDCISHAQSLGSGVAAQPELASELANYYRQHGKFERAIELLRPLAKAGVQGKKAELADLDAAWGDDLLRDGKLEPSLRCWEEVRDLREGSRFSEAESRLATIYQRLANSLASKKDDVQALSYLGKLNNIAQNYKNYEMAADIYLRDGKIDLAIDQLRKAITISSKNLTLDKKLSDLLARRGKELMDEGNTDAGMGYLQQAKDVNPENAIPNATLRSVTTSIDRGSRQPRIVGELWNPMERSISSLNLRVELFDNANSKSLWTKEQKIVDEFTSALGSHDSKSFDLTAPIVVKADGQTEFRTYIDGTLYKAYPIGQKDKDKVKDTENVVEWATPKKTKTNVSETKTDDTTARTASPATSRYTPDAGIFPAANKPANKPASVVPANTAPVPGTAQPEASTTAPTGKSGTAEEKTMKDLDL